MIKIDELKKLRDEMENLCKSVSGIENIIEEKLEGIAHKLEEIEMFLLGKHVCDEAHRSSEKTSSDYDGLF